MANPAVTYTFANSTTADATQVNTNFQNIIDSLTDGTKSLTIDALTCAGTATLNGAVTLGNGTPDDITWSGSLATSIPIKTNNSFDIGSSTIGLAGVYLGAPSSRTTRVRANQSLSGSNTLTLPDGNGTDGYGLATDGSGNLRWDAIHVGPGTIRNIGFAAATTTNANDSIKITGADGTALSSSNPGYVTIPSATGGRLTQLKITSDVTINLTGAHWGNGTFGDLTDYALHIYAINDAGSIKWGVCAVQALTRVDGADDTTTGTSVTTVDGVLVNSALTASANCMEVGWFRANFDDTGGAAEDLWAVQTGAMDILVGPAQPIPKKFTPIIGGQTSPTVVASWRREGSFVAVVGYSNGTDTTTDMSVSLPSGLTIDSAVTGTRTNTASLGKWSFMLNATTSRPWQELFFDGSDASKLFAAGNDDSSSFQWAKRTGTSYIGSSYTFVFEFKVPVVGWDGNVA